MVSFNDIQTVYDEVPLSELINRYVRRQKQGIEEDKQQFNIFLARFNQILNDKRVVPFYRTLLHELVSDISRHGYDEKMIRYFEILLELSKPQTTDRNILSSLEWQMEQTLRKSYNEYEYDDKLLLLFHIIFGNFDTRVQKSFVKLLNKYGFNDSMDLLDLMTYIMNYHNGEITLERFEKCFEALVSVYGIKSIDAKQVIIDTKHGVIPFSYASDHLGISDTSELRLGQCHFLVSDYLKKCPNMSGAYYYIPNNFKGTLEHSILIDYQEGYVYDLSHNIALPLEYFIRYYNEPKFTISGDEFSELSNRVEEKYDTPLYMHHLEEVDRELKKIK